MDLCVENISRRVLERRLSAEEIPTTRTTTMQCFCTRERFVRFVLSPHNLYSPCGGTRCEIPAAPPKGGRVCCPPRIDCCSRLYLCTVDLCPCVLLSLSLGLNFTGFFSHSTCVPLCCCRLEIQHGLRLTSVARTTMFDVRHIWHTSESYSPVTYKAK